MQMGWLIVLIFYPLWGVGQDCIAGDEGCIQKEREQVYSKLQQTEDSLQKIEEYLLEIESGKVRASLASMKDSLVYWSDNEKILLLRLSEYLGQVRKLQITAKTFNVAWAKEEAIAHILENMILLGNNKYLQARELRAIDAQALLGEERRVWKSCPYCPATYLSLEDIDQILSILREETRKDFRLPREEEWLEAAQRAEQLDLSAWYQGNAKGKCHLVGIKQVNALGFYDMQGNVWELCLDSQDTLVLKGGSWLNRAEDCALDFQYYPSLYVPFSNIGVRLVY